MGLRITVNEVLEAYRQTGIRPVCGIYYHPEQNCGCPQTVLYIAEHPEEPKDYDIIEKMYDWINEKYGNLYASAFRDGVDFGGQDIFTRHLDEIKGFDDGVAVWKAVRLEFILEGVDGN